ncbi:MAG: methylmalonyl-CoA mutase family protein [Deltaproteobacteria bacterium]|nr:methylmalonyl-CoA mutase family protein [Deltaproteobacteria bacterium]
MGKDNRIIEWEQKALAKSLARFPERKERFYNHGNEEIPRVLFPEKLSDKYISDIGFPGRYPFTRGVQATMYRGRLWTIRQYAGFSTAVETNARFRYLLDQGTTGLSIAFDLPTQIGYDSDDPLSIGEVGKVGVAVDTLHDMEILFQGIPLDKISTSMTINAPAAVLLAMYIALGEKQGVTSDKLQGTIQNDILKEYVARGTYIYPPKPSLRIITDIFQYCSRNLTSFNTISISGYHIREAGSTAAEEVAFTLANACTYVQAAINAGLEVDAFAKRLAFFFNASSNLLEEVAKFRAARRLWAKIMKNRFNAKEPASQIMRFHTQTAGNTLTAQQVDNNIVRVTIQALAAVLGGTQSLHTNSKDEALGLPTEDSVRTALRTQQIIAYESGVADTIDPLAGSYYIEEWTDRIEKQALLLMEEVEKEGGVVAAIEKGFIQRRIETSAYEYQKEIEKKERVIVGLNRFQSEESLRPHVLKIDPEVEDNQVNNLRELKKSRDHDKVDITLKALKHAAEGSTNLMEPILAAVKEYATLGEICNVLREVFGEYCYRG